MIELIMVVGVVGVLISAFVHAQMSTSNMIAYERSALALVSRGVQVLSSMEDVVRSSEQTLKAGTDILVVTSPYYIDNDAEVETIEYSRSGGNLYRRVAHGSAAYGDAELLLEGVTTFETNALEINDTFAATDYGSLLPVAVAGVMDVTTEDQVEYTVVELGALDVDAVSFYSAVDESILVPVTAGADQSITVAPALDAEGLSIQVDFTPIDGGAEYRPLVYGGEDSDIRGIAVVFADDSDVLLRLTNGGVQVAELAADSSWDPGSTYRLVLKFFEGNASAHMTNLTDATRPELVGTTSRSGIESARVQLQSITANKSARWDNLAIGYPVIDIHLGISLDSGGVENLYGGAKRRQP